MIFEKHFFKKFLEQFDSVPFSVNFKDEDEFVIGTGLPQFKVKINKIISKSDLLRSTSLALGEGYMNKDIEIEGNLFLALDSVLSKVDTFSVDLHGLDKLLHSSNSQKNQKKEVCSHYDIGNDFYKLWLDETLSYSCGYFKTENDTLYDAQVNKVAHILTKLNLKEGMSLLDVGCGWGFLLIEAAKKYKIHGTGITLSEEQFKEFQSRIKEEKLEDFLEVKLMDYRDLEKSEMSFDRVVSVGMIEHVGRDNYDLFFKNVNAVLKPQGIFLLHYISCLQESTTDPWISKYIFPGGVIPTLREIINICGDYNFYTLDVESLRLHYMKTLLCWYSNFNNHIDDISKMFDETFIRMWELYLVSCAAAFHTGNIDLHQILMTKGTNNDLPLTREYMYTLK